MSDTIDLDLVELRCRLRGWTCERRAGLIPEVRIAAPEGGVWLAADGTYGGVSMYGRDERGGVRPVATPAYYRDAGNHVARLTTPRWTLDRLRDAPPEWWRSEGQHTAKLVRSGAEVVFDPLLGVQEWIDPRRPYAERAAAHAAVAELFLILAEVEP